MAVNRHQQITDAESWLAQRCADWNRYSPFGALYAVRVPDVYRWPVERLCTYLGRELPARTVAWLRREQISGYALMEELTRDRVLAIEELRLSERLELALHVERLQRRHDLVQGEPTSCRTMWSTRLVDECELRN